MTRPSSADHSVSPPRVEIPRNYNAAHDLIERNLRAGRGAKIAFHDSSGGHTYAELAKSHLAMHKYPRWIEFMNELPKTVTGKIQRFKLRALAQALPAARTHSAI